MSALLDIFSRIHDQWGDLIEIAGILLVTILLTMAISVVIGFWRRHHAEGRHSSVLFNATIDAVGSPLQALVWITGLNSAIGHLDVSKHVPWMAPWLMPILEPVRNIAVIAVFAWFLGRVVPRATRRLVARGNGGHFNLDVTAADAINKTVIALIVLGALLAVLKVLGLSLASLLTFGGVAGVAIGFAAQGLVANLLGGITIYASRPFGVDDHIIFPGTDLRGVVDEIGWRATRVVGWDGRPFYVPNAKFNTETIINHSRLTFRRIAETIRVRLQDIDKIPAIVKDVQDMLAHHPEMEHDRAYHVFNLDTVGTHALELYLYAYCKSTAYVDFMEGKQDILLKTTAIIEHHGAELAVPVQALYAPEGLRVSANPTPVAEPDTRTRP